MGQPAKPAKTYGLDLKIKHKFLEIALHPLKIAHSHVFWQ